MEGTAVQLYVLIVCLGAGILGGIAYEPFYLLRKMQKNRIAGIVLDILFFVVFAGIFVFISVLFEFPSLRPYMLAGSFLGLLLYSVSLHRIVAFLTDKLYNISKKLRLRLHRKSAGKTNERGKV